MNKWYNPGCIIEGPGNEKQDVYIRNYHGQDHRLPDSLIVSRLVHRFCHGDVCNFIGPFCHYKTSNNIDSVSLNHLMIH